MITHEYGRLIKNNNEYIMLVILLSLLCFFSHIAAENSTVLHSEYPWLRLPRTPTLPLPRRGQYIAINGIRIWYKIYGPKNARPLLFLHGGFANSDYWGLQVRKLKSKYRCILMDSRGQGRSTTSSANITYNLMASDVIALLDHLQISKTNLVGWSDGAIIGLNIAMNYPGRLSSLFAFAANYVPEGVKDISASPVFMAYLTRSQAEYEAKNPRKNYAKLYDQLTTMWASLPKWNEQDFCKNR